MAKKKTTKKKNEHIYKKGEDLGQISKKLTGNSYNIYILLLKSGYSMEDLPDGALLKWE